MRTVAKPVSNMVKSTVKDYPTFRALAVGGARLHARTNARWDRVVTKKTPRRQKGQSNQPTRINRKRSNRLGCGYNRRSILTVPALLFFERVN